MEWGLHTNHSQINSLLPQSTILPPSSLPHLSLFYPTFTPPSFSCLLPPSPHLLQPLSLQLCPPLFCFHVFSPLPHLLCVAPRFIPRASGPENQVSETKKKRYLCARGMGGGLCPWSRCLTWAKSAKQPHCQGSGPGCKPGQRGQTGGQETRGWGGPQGRHAL